MSQTTSDQSATTSVTKFIELKASASPAFSLDLFDREVIEPNVPGEPKRVLITCNARRCNITYNHPYPGNTTTLLSHYKSKHRSELIALGKKAVDSGNLRDKTILGTNLLEGLTYLPPNINNYFKFDKSLSNRKPDHKVTKPAHANCSPELFNKLFTQFLIGSNIPFIVCDSIFAKRMLDGARFGLSKVVSRGQMTLQLKNLYFQEVTSLRKEFKEHDGRFVLTMDEWKASNGQKFLGITVHFIDKYFVLKSYYIGLEHIPKKNGNAHTLAQTLINVVRYYHIDDRIISISRDNASAMTKVISNFTHVYRGKGVDENFNGDIGCFGHVSNLTVKALMRIAFPKNIVADTDSLDNDDYLDEEV